MATKPQESQTLLSDLISRAMEDQNLSIRGLAEKLSMTYEHARRIVRGEGIPSDVVLRAICNELGLNFKEAQQLSVASKIRVKYGDIPFKLAGKNPELDPIERVWSLLTESQKNDATNMIQGWARRNRAQGV